MNKKEMTDLFFDAVLTLETREELKQFFGDACTPKEIETFALRFTVGKMIHEKKVYSEITEATGASTATISRVSRATSDGYKIALDRLPKAKK